MYCHWGYKSSDASPLRHSFRQSRRVSDIHKIAVAREPAFSHSVSYVRNIALKQLCRATYRSDKRNFGEGKRATGLEPATSSLGSWHSTTELRPLVPGVYSYPYVPYGVGMSASLLLLERKAPGLVLLSHSIHCSTIGAGGLNGRVRDGNGCGPSAIETGENFLGTEPTQHKMNCQAYRMPCLTIS